MHMWGLGLKAYSEYAKLPVKKKGRFMILDQVLSVSITSPAAQRRLRVQRNRTPQVLLIWFWNGVSQEQGCGDAEQITCFIFSLTEMTPSIPTICRAWAS